MINNNSKHKFFIANLFPKSPEQISNLVKQYISESQKTIENIVSLKDDQRTFANTVKVFDTLCALSNVSTLSSALTALEMLSPKEEIRKAAYQGIIEIQRFWVDNISNNVKLYNALKTYAQSKEKTKKLTEEEKYFLAETLKDFKRSGLDLPKDKREKVKKLQKELAELGLAFETNIAADQSHIIVSEDELEGLDKDFIATLQKTDDDKIILGIDYPTYFNVMDNCNVESTRKKLYITFNNRAYPKNEEILKQIIEKRDELANTLGFASYAQLDLDSEMAKNPDIAETFLNDLYEKAAAKTKKEFETLSSELPKSAELADDKTIKAWDMRYIKNQHKKKHFAIDEQKIAEYFPLEHTIKELLHIYEQFFNLTFKQSKIAGLWHEDIQLIDVYKTKTNELIGHLLIDLHPRPNKYSHACQLTVVPSVKNHGPSVCLVVANFPKSTANKPSLLKINDVETFFHEFGHAIHAILGRTNIASFSGTSVKTDFVEMPSQMLEEWLYDKGIIKKKSSDYKTGKPLPDKIIDKIIALKQFDSGDFLQRQCYLSQLALAYFKPGASKDPKNIFDSLQSKMRKHVAYAPEDNMYASFGHLSGYGARYYSYMWSKVYALDLFNHIKQYGLLNPAIGQKYIDEILAKGGSEDPNNLLKNFLGRKPNEKAFLENMGLLKKE